jgi:hypothetical protein
MKALDFLSEFHKVRNFIFLAGSDIFLKQLVLNKIQTEIQVSDIEKRDDTSVKTLSETISSGSLLGPRLVISNLEIPKWGKMEDFKDSMRVALDNGDHLIVKCEEEPKIEDSDLISHTLIIDCEPIKVKKSREKFLNLRLKHHSVLMFPEAVTALIDRTENSSDLENIILSFKYAFPNKTIGVKDIDRVRKRQEERSDIQRAVVTSNSVRLTKIINEEEPRYVIYTLHSVLLKLYSYLEMAADSEITEETIVEKLQIDKRYLKEWREAKKKYASTSVRELIEVVSDAFRIYTSSNSANWRDQIHFKLRNLSK